MNDIDSPGRLQEIMNDEFIVLHICVVATGLLISGSGFILASL